MTRQNGGSDPGQEPVARMPAVVAVAAADNPMHRLLGGWRGGLESAAPSVVFVLTYAVAGHALPIALLAALAVAVVLAAARLLRRERPVRVLAGLIAVGVAAAVAARTGNAADYFLPSLLANLVSALAWGLSILVGWPLLGIAVGLALRQRTSWRADPDLLRAYGRASWLWAASFLIRAGVQLPLWLSDSVIGLGIARVALGWPMVLAVIGLSWVVIRRALPAGHPGMLHPRITGPENPATAG